MLGHLQLAEEGVVAALKYGGAGLEGERLDLVLEVGGLLLQLADLTLLVPDLWETRGSLLHIMYRDQAPHPNPICKFPVLSLSTGNFSVPISDFLKISHAKRT